MLKYLFRPNFQKIFFEPISKRFVFYPNSKIIFSTQFPKNICFGRIYKIFLASQFKKKSKKISTKKKIYFSKFLIFYFLGIALERMFSSNSMNSIPEESVNRPTEASELILFIRTHLSSMIASPAILIDLALNYNEDPIFRRVQTSKLGSLNDFFCTTIFASFESIGTYKSASIRIFCNY